MDISPAKLAERRSDLIAGQLLTPLTKYRNHGGRFAIDNGAFSRFSHPAFSSLLRANEEYKASCIFVAVPDIVGSARRTLELWGFRARWVHHWPAAFVAQDGAESFDLPWDEMAAVFIGGRDPWKDSQAAADIVKTAKTLGKHVHVGRVNTIARYKHFNELGADTCDGSGVARYSHMLKNIEDALAGGDCHPLFDGCSNDWQVLVERTDGKTRAEIREGWQR